MGCCDCCIDCGRFWLQEVKTILISSLTNDFPGDNQIRLIFHVFLSETVSRHDHGALGTRMIGIDHDTL